MFDVHQATSIAVWRICVRSFWRWWHIAFCTACELSEKHMESPYRSRDWNTRLSIIESIAYSKRTKSDGSHISIQSILLSLERSCGKVYSTFITHLLPSPFHPAKRTDTLIPCHSARIRPPNSLVHFKNNILKIMNSNGFLPHFTLSCIN